jgi:hypothetical protein
VSRLQTKLTPKKIYETNKKYAVKKHANSFCRYKTRTCSLRPKKKKKNRASARQQHQKN